VAAPTCWSPHFFLNSFPDLPHQTPFSFLFSFFLFPFSFLFFFRYGRRLVLEWAQDDSSVDVMREKTLRKFQAIVPHKKRKLNPDTFLS
jgi:hypothetical protein